MNKVSGYRTFFHGFGILVGPVMGGFLMFYLGFSRLMETVALIFIVVGIADILFIIKEYKEQKNKPDLQITNIRDPEESQRLLQEDETQLNEEHKLPMGLERD